MKKTLVACGVIPARLGSHRLEGKVLLLIAGKPMIQHVYERAKRSKLLNEVIVATDHRKVLEAVRGFGGFAVMTPKHCVSGTDRVAQAMRHRKADIVINIQGDEPMLHPDMVDALVRAFLKDGELQMATLATRIKKGELADPNAVKVVRDNSGFALYFSRSAIPYARDEKMLDTAITRHVVGKHIGIYGYRREFLLRLNSMKPSVLEKVEKLEQLRVLENACRIKVIETRHDTIGVDTREDLKRVRSLICRSTSS